MARKIRLTESELVQLIKKSLNEQQDADWWKKLNPPQYQTKANERKKSLEDAWCSVKNGVVTKFLPLQMQWCGPNGYAERMQITYDGKCFGRKMSEHYFKPTIRHKTRFQ
jgi:hypothetical protein